MSKPTTITQERPGLLTAGLIFVVAANVMLLVLYWLGRHTADRSTILFALIAVFNLICAGALFAWKKWGFWGLCASTAVVLIADLILVNGMNRALLGLVSIALLYAGLQVGRGQKGWDRLD
ncbi:MAG: hypothetical protein JXJ17_12555 [Anaerolineae bacterium]|nr:hypothetical protein [Anaerolineae bacterium]